MKTGYKRVTRADVARRAGVSETIVSYVINKNRYVAQNKKELVEKAVKELNYYPYNAARTLKGKKSNNIVFIADQITNEHFSKLIAEMDKYAYDKGYMVSLCSNRNNEEFVSQIISHQYDGVVISSISFPQEYIATFISAGLPVVLLSNRDYDNEIIRGAGKIGTGLYDGARKCIRHLVERGRKNILYIDRFSSQGHFSTMDDLRLRGVSDEMKASGILMTESNIVTDCRTPEKISEKIRQRISSGQPIDAIFGRNDRLACIGMQTVMSMGYRVPEDIAVIGFDNSSLSQYTSPTLTTVEMQREEIGKAAISMLQQMIYDDKPVEPRYFETRLICRQSTAV